MRIGILGVGALGGLFLHRLSEVESELHLLTRSPTKDALDERGLMVHYDGRPDILEVVPCLLYTSPSPRDRQKSRMPSSA